MEIIIPRGCCILQFSPGEQAGIRSLIDTRAAEEWRSAGGADLLVSRLLLSASRPEEGTTRTLVQTVRF